MYNKSMNQKEKMVNKIEGRLQFVIVLGVFFLTLVYGIAKLAGDTEQGSQASAVGASIVVLGYIVAYVFFAIWGERIKELGLKWINGTIIFGIACYISPILLMGLSTAKDQPKMAKLLAFTYFIPYVGSVYGLIIVPIIVALFVIFWPKNKSI